MADQLVDEVTPQQAGDQRTPTLDQQPGDAACAELVERIREIDPAARIGLGTQDGDRPALQRRDPFRRCSRGADQDRRSLARSRHEMPVVGQCGGAIEDDTNRRGVGEARQPAIEPGVVGLGRAPADGDRIVAGACEVAVDARGFAGDPLALAGGGGDPPVERMRRLHRDQWPPFGLAEHEAEIEGVRLLAQYIPHHRHAAFAQAGEAAAGHTRIGILYRGDDARDTGGDQRISARRGLPMMAAGLEGDVSGGAG